MTLTKINYDVSLGNVIPLTIKLIKKESDFLKLIEETNNFYYKLKNSYSKDLAEYVLTNSHKCKVLFKINARNLYNFLMLRLDRHAQWDIRNLSKTIFFIVKKYAPITVYLLQKYFEEIE